MSAEQWHVNEKILLDKIDKLKNKTNKKIMIYVNDPKETLLLYLFYKNNDPFRIKKILSEENLSIGRIYFSNICPQEKLDDSIQIMNSSRCPVNTDVFKSEVFVTPETNISSNYLLLN